MHDIGFFFPISNTPKSSNSLWLIVDADTDIVIYFQTTSRLSCTGINIFVLCSENLLCMSLNAGSFIYVSSCVCIRPTGTLAGCLLLQKVQLSQICIYSDLCIDLLCFLREYTINTCSCCVNAFSYQQKCSFRFADILLYITKEFVVMEHENKYQQKVITFHLRKFNFVMLYYSVIYYV